MGLDAPISVVLVESDLSLMFVDSVVVGSDLSLVFVDSGLTETPLVDLVDIACFLNEVVADFLPLPFKGFSLFSCPQVWSCCGHLQL